MSIILANLGGSQTGGSSTTLSFQNSTNGRATFTAPSHTRLTPQTIEFVTSTDKVSSADPGVARAQLRITFADRQTAEEGCCTVKAGLVAMDINVRWHMSQPETLVDIVIDYLQALAFSAEFADMIKKGTLPS
jgi:hypothetical protein